MTENAAGTTHPLLSWKDGKLFKSGLPHQMFSGSMQYFRVHPDQWEDRLRRLAALGMNTVDTYVAWNFHERVEGELDFSQWRDLERYLHLAQSVGLDVFLRPGPYICAEWSNGGLPPWLTGRVEALRTSHPDFLSAVDAWFDELIPRIAPLQAAHGGPIVAVQVENEYGSYGSDRAYLEHIRDGLISRGIVELLTTADGTTADMQDHGSVAGAMPTFTFGSGVERAVELQREDVPFVCSEMWGGWFDHWSEPHHVRSAQSMMGTINEILDLDGSFSLYMAHGGTNFGFWNGANFDGVLQPTVTSYDYDAPIAEDGRVNEKFLALRAALEKRSSKPLPALPPEPRFLAPASLELTSVADLPGFIDSLPDWVDHPTPLTFEELGAEDGFVAYRADVHFEEGAELHIDELHDRATVLLDSTFLGTLMRDERTSLPLPGGGAASLTILVESLGRINYGARTGEGKGIMAGVRIGRRLVHGWRHALVPLEVPAVSGTSTSGATSNGAGVGTAKVSISEPLDAWLALPGSDKAAVWLNGFLLGRYWSVGPQRTVYAPAPLWREGENTITVLDVDCLGPVVEIRQEPELGPREEFIGF